MDNINTNNQLDEKTKLIIQEMEKALSLKEKEISSKDAEINQLKIELEYLKAQILNKNKKIFGRSGEQVAYGQISIFNEAEKYSDKKIEEPVIENIAYTRTKPSKNKGKKDNLANLEKVIIEHKLEPNEQICDKCGNKLVKIGTKSKQILKFKPAKLYIEEHISYSYDCKFCEEQEDKSHIITTKIPATLLHKSMASNELLSHVINLKYQQHLPLYRQENYFKMLGANLSRQTLSNWIIGAAREFDVVYKKMKEELLKQSYIQADETTLVVIDDRGQESKSKKYMWLYKTGSDKDPIILYDYQRTRSGSCPRDFLKGFSGILQSDGYAGYSKVENAKRLYCLAHIRRKYHEIIKPLDKEALKTSKAIIGFNYCEKLYSIEKELKKAYSKDTDYHEKRYQIRLEKSAPIIDEFITYVDNEIVNALPRSPLGKALAYTQKLLPGFKIFLEDGALEIDNNASERAIKPFVLGRKNWLFSNTPKGAAASATLYSIIETAKANHLIVEKYLIYLMEQLANRNANIPDDILKIMPWSKGIPNELRIKINE